MSIHVGILGPGLFGKTHAAKALSRQYAAQGRRSIVLDPNGDNWGAHAMVFTDRKKFFDFVWSAQDCAVFCDEFGEVMHRDKEASSFFTRIRHRGHIFHAITHDWTDMLPRQRNQLGKLLVFWQPAKAAAVIADEWSDDRLLESTKLPKYEFLYCQKFGDAPRHKITRGRFPA